MSADRNPDESGPGARRRRWVGAGLFFLVAPAIGVLWWAIGRRNPTLGGLVAIIATVGTLYLLNRRGKDVLQGFLLALAVTLVVGGGACAALIYTLTRSFG